MKVTIYSDGGSRGNPGPAACGFVVFDEDEKTVYEGKKFLGEATNNVAEYKAVLLAYEWLVGQEDIDKVIFVVDSELVERQLNGLYKVKNENLKMIYEKIKMMEKKLESVTYTHVTRDKNSRADSLVNEVLDEAIRGTE